MIVRDQSIIAFLPQIYPSQDRFGFLAIPNSLMVAIKGLRAAWPFAPLPADNIPWSSGVSAQPAWLC